MKALRKTVTAASALLCGIAAFGAGFEKAPVQLPEAIPVQMSLPFAAVPADALNALDPLSRAQPAIDSAQLARPAKLTDSALVLSAAQLDRFALKFKPGIGDRPGAVKASAENQSQSAERQFDGSGELPIEPEVRAPAAIGTGGVVKTPLANPERYYDRAFSEAVYYASRKGVSREGVSLEKITGNIPASEDAPHLMYAFDAQAQGKALKIYVDFSPRWAVPGQDYGSRASVYDVGATPQERVSSHQESVPAALRSRLRASPQRALDLARQKLPELSTSVSFKLGLVRGDPTYVFYDSRGGRAAVSARTGQVSVLERPSVARGAGAQYRRVKDAFHKLVRRVSSARPKMTRAQIESAAASAATHKGRPWSQTEYDANRASFAYHLQTHGATQAQIKLFYELTDKAPILNGGFNPWAGD